MAPRLVRWVCHEVEGHCALQEPLQWIHPHEDRCRDHSSGHDWHLLRRSSSDTRRRLASISVRANQGSQRVSTDPHLTLTLTHMPLCLVSYLSPAGPD